MGSRETHCRLLKRSEQQNNDKDKGHCSSIHIHNRAQETGTSQHPLCSTRCKYVHDPSTKQPHLESIKFQHHIKVSNSDSTERKE